MSKKSFFSVRTMVHMALLVALQIILTRILVVDLGAYRISFGSLATILAGLWLGPLCGSLCGFAADILGCFLKGFAINPFITAAAICWGLIPGLCRNWMASRSLTKKGKTLHICLSIVVCAIIGSLALTTAGLVLLLGYNLYAILPGRIVQTAILTPCLCVLTNLLYFSPLTAMAASPNSGNSAGSRKSLA